MILVDTGALLALLNQNDRHHQSCVQGLRDCREPLATAWPVLTETMTLAARLPAAREALWEMLARQAVRLLPLGENDGPRLRQLMTKYRSRSMRLAHASLVRLAEREGITTVFTVENAAFEAYRIHGRKAFRRVPGRASGRR